MSKQRTVEIPKPLDELSDVEIERKRYITRIMTFTQKYLTDLLINDGFEWLRPVMISPSTDPLWPDPGASIEKRIEFEIYGRTVRTTLSMIIHKIVACSLAYPKLFIWSPNIRIEKRERAYTGIHLYEFTQLDFEIRDASSRDVMRYVEKLFCNLIDYLKRNLRDELLALGRYHELKVPETPFKVYDRKELEDKYGNEWETKLSLEIDDPVWVTNIPREFYDYEDIETGRWDNYDLFLPKFGEVLSGAKREWEYEKIIMKMERDKVRKENYQVLLKLAKNKKLKPTAGGGIGLERLVAWITGVKHVGETQPFPKVPGMVYEL